jgi:hypothetical protein
MSDTVNTVCADRSGLSEPLRLGYLSSHRAAAREVFDFEFLVQCWHIPPLRM